MSTMIYLKKADHSDLDWVLQQLEEDFNNEDEPETHAWRNRSIITASLDCLYMIEIHDSPYGFLLYNRPIRDSITMLWIHPEQRFEGYGRAAVEEHCRQVIEQGRTVDVVQQPMSEAEGFWEKCGYTEMDCSVYHNINPGTFRRKLINTPIRQVILTGDLPRNRDNITDLLKRSCLPYFNTAWKNHVGLIRVNKGNLDLNIQGPNDWKLYDLTLREVIALKGLLAEEGITVDAHNFHF